MITCRACGAEVEEFTVAAVEDPMSARKGLRLEVLRNLPCGHEGGFDIDPSGPLDSPPAGV